MSALQRMLMCLPQHPVSAMRDWAAAQLMLMWSQHHPVGVVRAYVHAAAHVNVYNTIQSAPCETALQLMLMWSQYHPVGVVGHYIRAQIHEGVAAVRPVAIVAAAIRGARPAAGRLPLQDRVSCR